MNIHEALKQLSTSSSEFSQSESESDIILSDNLSESSSCSENCERIAQNQDKTFISKDGNFHFTTLIPKNRGRKMAHNIVKKPAGIPRFVNSRMFSPLSSIQQFLTEDIVNKIIDSTNAYIENNTNETFRLSLNDFWLYIGALFYLGIMKSRNSSSIDMWDKEKGIAYLSKRNNIFYINSINT